MSILDQPQFHDDAAAFAMLESILWPDGPVCPKCGCIGRSRRLGGKSSNFTLLGGNGRPGNMPFKSQHDANQLPNGDYTVFDDGSITPQTVINDPGYINVGGSRIADWDGANKGNITMTRVLELSYNVGAIKAEQMMRVGCPEPIAIMRRRQRCGTGNGNR